MKDLGISILMEGMPAPTSAERDWIDQALASAQSSERGVLLNQGIENNLCNIREVGGCPHQDVETPDCHDCGWATDTNTTFGAEIRRYGGRVTHTKKTDSPATHLQSIVVAKIPWHDTREEIKVTLNHDGNNGGMVSLTFDYSQK
jgi:hypothetical protein